MVCLQETKLASTSNAKARSFLPPSFRDFHCVDARGSRGGILTAWDAHSLTLHSFITRKHTLTTVLTSTVTDILFTITNVYAPADHRDSLTFLEDFANLAPHVSGSWLLAGDFNLLRENFLRLACSDRSLMAVRERAAYWKQRGKFRAIREADANTAFHHAHASVRLHRNQIKTLVIDDVEVTAHDAKAEALTAYFSSILGSGTTPAWYFDVNSIYSTSPRVDLTHLAAPFTCAEAKLAIQQMNRNSAPGPDGFGPGFYVAAWETVAPKILQFVHAFC
ncbi:hypothetical protein GQ55_3G488300 [Panicum hallii var. hallii]|uniref:Endonuclease/exonuclease/phosphatase domain-containing protein n=1 Tax=Panicum hallii var. hallii TaxID=1504633 RepID=A0A2T7EJU1_9POAL|nr:hypothetical protein GQ55_3G488300 [Panicum hallii var. hallii]